MTATLGLLAIAIGGREYRVAKDGDGYLLTGARGARYRTLRSLNRPGRLYLYNVRNWTWSAPQVWLTDANGKLEVL
jgi:hypothetical protein